jgi:extracellular factor (EF) 3-hydroxypalmitic acid methyl ester biosynthesis protein
MKPRGYAGDAEAMQMAYANTYVGDGLFNQLLHKHPLETQAAEAVRGRRTLVVKVIREVLARFPGLPRHGFRFLSLASGPASEMADLLAEREDLDRFHCEFLDQDADALEMARQTIQAVERRHRGRVDARYIGESVRTMLRSRANADRLGRYHVVYSMGLFDYLTPPVARAVLARAFDLLLPGGTLVVGNYHVNNRTRLYMDYWMDWPLYYRTEESFLELARDLPAINVSLGFDETGCQMFLRLDRPAEPAE